MLTPIQTLYSELPFHFFFSVIVFLSMIAVGTLLTVRLYRTGKIDRTQRTACIVLVLWCAIVFFMTVLDRRRSSDLTNNWNLVLFSCYRLIFIEQNIPMLISTLQNILMFVPIGFTLSIVFKNKHRIIIPLALSFGFSLLIESSQLIAHLGFFELDDLFNNTLGALIGTACCLLIRKKSNKKS